MTELDKMGLRILRLIAEGYRASGYDDRFVRVENPDYRPDNGSDPFIVWDLQAAATSAGVTEKQVEAAAKWMARDHAMSGNRSMEAVEEHVAKHWKRYSREAGDILTAAWLTSPASRVDAKGAEA